MKNRCLRWGMLQLANRPGGRGFSPLSSSYQRVLPHRQAARPVSPRRGSALLTVMWLSAALAAIGFSLAGTVRGETERTSTGLDGLRSYYLATGGIERASL